MGSESAIKFFVKRLCKKIWIVIVWICFLSEYMNLFIINASFKYILYVFNLYNHMSAVTNILNVGNYLYLGTISFLFWFKWLETIIWRLLYIWFIFEPVIKFISILTELDFMVPAYIFMFFEFYDGYSITGKILYKIFCSLFLSY